MIQEPTFWGGLSYSRTRGMKLSLRSTSLIDFSTYFECFFFRTSGRFYLVEVAEYERGDPVHAPARIATLLQHPASEFRNVRRSRASSLPIVSGVSFVLNRKS